LEHAGHLIFLVMASGVLDAQHVAEEAERVAELQPHFIPSTPRSQLHRRFQASNFGIDLWNSVVITLGAVLVSLVVGFFGALAIGPLPLRRQEGDDLHRPAGADGPADRAGHPGDADPAEPADDDTLYGIVLTYLVFTVALHGVDAARFHHQHPRELDEGGDGRRLQPLADLYLRVILPLTGPGLVATSVYGFIQAGTSSS